MSHRRWQQPTVLETSGPLETCESIASTLPPPIRRPFMKLLMLGFFTLLMTYSQELPAVN